MTSEQSYNTGGIELTACQLHEALLMAGTPELGVPFEDRGRVRIFQSETGHSGPGLYCECVDVEEEGCILLDGTSPAIATPAQAVDLERARNEGHDGAIRYVLGYLCGMGDWGSTQYVEILNGCGRESIIRSAIEDGELEFTGLGRWVAERGTDEERALIASQAVQS